MTKQDNIVIYSKLPIERNDLANLFCSPANSWFRFRRSSGGRDLNRGLLGTTQERAHHVSHMNEVTVVREPVIKDI